MKCSLIRKIALLTVCAMLLVFGLSACQSSNNEDLHDAVIDQEVEGAAPDQESEVENKAPEKVDDTPNEEEPEEKEPEK